MKMRNILSILALAVLLPVSAIAAPIYQQGNISTADRGAYQYFGQALADDFVAVSTGAISNATWTGSYYGNIKSSGSESFTFNIFAGGSTPGALLYSSVGTASFVASATPSYFDYSLNLLGPILNAGLQYWVSIYSNDSPQNYAWANSFDGTSSGALSNFGGAWRDITGDRRANHVFALNGSAVVPEPATLALLGLGLFGMGFARKAKQ